MIDINLDICFTRDELHQEFFWYLDHQEGSRNLSCNKNKIVKQFQQDVFYRHEKELWKDDDIKVRLIANRCKYLNKTPEELTTLDILRGFKISGIWYGYSGFNPMVCKFFYNHLKENYGEEHIRCYDPCGGWGHRVLGSVDIDQYIYNDINTEVCKNIQDMCDYFDMYDVVVYNKDAVGFVPDDDFNVMFTCPPYYNLEVYDNGPYASRDEYDRFIDGLFDVFHKKTGCKYFGMVIREDFIGAHTDYVEKIELINHASQYLNDTQKHKYKEYLYIWKK